MPKYKHMLPDELNKSIAIISGDKKGKQKRFANDIDAYEHSICLWNKGRVKISKHTAMLIRLMRKTPNWRELLEEYESYP